MNLSFDPAKRESNLFKHGFDFLDAPAVFAGRVLTREDPRRDYGEVRYQTMGLLAGRLVMIVWTARGDATHVISMRKCNARERTKNLHRLG